MSKSQERTFWRIVIPASVAIAIIFAVGLARSAVMVPVVSCLTVDEAIKIAEQDSQLLTPASVGHCRINTVMLPNNPSDLKPIYLKKVGKMMNVVIQTQHADGETRYTIVYFQPKGQEA